MTEEKEKQLKYTFTQQMNRSYHETINIFLQPRNLTKEIKDLIQQNKLMCRVSFLDKKTRINGSELVKILNTQFDKSVLCTFIFERTQTVLLEMIHLISQSDNTKDSQMEKIAEVSFEIGELIGSKNNQIAKQLKDQDLIWETGIRIPGKRVP